MPSSDPENIVDYRIIKKWLEIIVKEPLLDIACLEIAIAILGLNARFGRQLILQEHVRNRIFLVGIRTPTICPEIGESGADRKFSEDAGNDTFSHRCVIAAIQAIAEKREPVAIDHQGIELAKRRAGWTDGTQQQKIADGLGWLDRRDVLRL